MEKIGVIGLGIIGSLIVKRLLKNDIEIIAHDMDPNKMALLKPLGLKLAGSPADVAANSSWIITCVTDAQTVEDVLIGNNGVIDTIKPGSVVVEMSPSTPITTRRVAEFLEKRGADIIDAPVSSEVSANGEHTLSFVIGGKEEVLERCRPILSFLGTNIIHVGDLGSGHIVKALTLMMLGANLVSAAEIVGLGVKSGLDRKKILDVINVSSGENIVTSNHYLKHILQDTYDSHISMELMLQNIMLSTQIAHQMDVSALVATRLEEIYAMACNHGAVSEDSMKIVPYIQGLMGLQAEDF
ncbi:NAD(P)-dependent oxidoreductase [Desulfosporosinus burensis]